MAVRNATVVDISVVTVVATIPVGEVPKRKATGLIQ
jgi:hypothetical protein